MAASSSDFILPAYRPPKRPRDLPETPPNAKRSPLPKIRAKDPAGYRKFTAQIITTLEIHSISKADVLKDLNREISTLFFEKEGESEVLSLFEASISGKACVHVGIGILSACSAIKRNHLQFLTIFLQKIQESCPSTTKVLLMKKVAEFCCRQNEILYANCLETSLSELDPIHVSANYLRSFTTSPVLTHILDTWSSKPLASTEERYVDPLDTLLGGSPIAEIAAVATGILFPEKLI